MSSNFNIKELGGSFQTFDYVVLGLLCVISCSGGIWYGAVGSRGKALLDLKDYLLGGKSMSTFPVAMSLIASYVSGVTILGTPSEIYNYGSQYWLVVVAVALSCFVVATVYLPVFCTLRLSSSYEYLEIRFNRQVRAVASILFLLDEILFLPMVIYVPALAFNQLTGVNIHIISCAMVVVCGLYTVLGGLRAVVWTDSVQTFIMFLGVVMVAFAGTNAVGGFKNVIDVTSENGRLSLDNWSFSMYERQTGWGSVVGGFIYWTCFNSVNQTMVQRYIALPSKNKTICAIIIFCFGAIFAISLCVWNGLIAWTAWVQGGCHPEGAPVVDDRLLPAFVTWVSRVNHLPGLSGVFLAGVFGAGVSSLSAVLNACALVMYEDLMRGWLRLDMKPRTEAILTRIFTATLALLAILMVVVIEKLGGVLGVATALSSIASSTTCGIFTLGMVCWWVGPRGALVGGVAGALVAGTVSFGTQTAAAHGLLAPPMNFTDQCAVNASFVPPQSIDPGTIFPLFRVSYLWIAPIGFLVTLVVGAVSAYFLDDQHERVLDAELFTPVVWWWLPLEAHENSGWKRRTRVTRLGSPPAPSAPLIMESLHKIEVNGNTT